MGTKTPIAILEEEERRARIRLAAYRARLYRHNGASPIVVDRRLRELERKWNGAAKRLRQAKHERKG
jgi:hypothetical protein